MSLDYQKIQQWKRAHREDFTQSKPANNRLKGGANLDGFDVNFLIESAFKMADDLDEIHKMTASANGNETEIVETIQAMFN